MKLKQKRMIKLKTKKLINSFKYAIEGFITSFKEERNMKIHIIIMIMVIFAGRFYRINIYEWITCITLFGMVIAGELFNTAIEAVVDIAMPYKNQKAKKAKDISAAAVLILSMCAAIIGLTIFIPKML